MIRIVLCDDNQEFLSSLQANIHTVLEAYGIDAVTYSAHIKAAKC